MFAVSGQMIDRDELAEAITANPGVFQSLGPAVQADRDMACTAVSGSADNFYWATDFRDDPYIALLAIQGNAKNNFKLAGPTVRNNLDIAREAIDRWPQNFRLAGPDVKNNFELASFAIQRAPEQFQYASEHLRDDVRFALPAIFSEGVHSSPAAARNFMYVGQRIKNNFEIALEFLKANPLCFAWVGDQLHRDQGFCFAAATQCDARVIQNMPDEIFTPEFCLALVINKPELIAVLPPRIVNDRRFLQTAISRNRRVASVLPDQQRRHLEYNMTRGQHAPGSLRASFVDMCT